MGKRTRTRTTIIRDNPDEDLEERGESTAHVESDGALNEASEFIAKNRGTEGCRVRIRRQTPQGREFCASEPPSAIPNVEDYLAEYHAKQSYAHETGVYFVAVEVHGEIQSSFTVRIAPQTSAPAMAGGMAQASPLEYQVRELKEMVMRQQQQEKTPVLELVEGMQKIQQMQGGGQQPLSMDGMVKLIEIGAKINGGGGGSDGGWEGMARDVLKENAPAIISLLQFGAAKVSEFLTKPAPGQQPPPQQPTQSQPEQPMIEVTAQERQMLVNQINFLKSKALRGSDPGLYVAMMSDNADDPIYARLISKIVNTEFSEFAAEFDPEIGQPQFRDFFGFIHDRIGQLFKPKNKVATAGKREGGHKGHASGNGTTGKSGGE